MVGGKLSVSVAKEDAFWSTVQYTKTAKSSLCASQEKKDIAGIVQCRSGNTTLVVCSEGCTSIACTTPVHGDIKAICIERQ